MASICSISIPPVSKSLNPYKTRNLPASFSNSIPFSLFSTLSFRSRKSRATNSPSSTVEEEDQRRIEASMGIDALQSFIDLNLGKWNGSFHQFDSFGNLMHKVSTKLAVSSYGEDELISLLQTLYIKQPQSSTSISGYDHESEWADYKIKEINMFTADKYQQIGFFPNERAFSLRYQRAGMLETVLRQGVLGEDDTGEESPKNLKLPSRWPSIVCENCLYSREKDMRARAFHIMDPKGILEMLLVFLEERGDGLHFPSSLDDSKDNVNRIVPFLGKWKGHSMTKRSGVYGATIAKADTVALLKIDDKGRLVQDISSTSSGGNVTTNMHWIGTISDNLVTFNGGFQLTLLPGGMYMGCPCDVAKSVAESKSFHLEFCWLESPGKRQRLVRTYDVEGLAVSSTYFSETKLGQAEKEFKVEVEAIGRVRHNNLVRLLGYCAEGAHRMLVYEYVDNGNLEQWLHGDVGPYSPLTWEIRMNIMIGTAKGLTYLHEGLEPKVVHRDIKSSNILLDKQWNPKVSDLALPNS